MAMKLRKRTTRRAGEKAGTSADEPALRRGGAHGGDTARRYSVEEKLVLVDEFVKGGDPDLSARGLEAAWIKPRGAKCLALSASRKPMPQAKRATLTEGLQLWRQSR